MSADHALDLPRKLQIEFSAVVQAKTDAEGGEKRPFRRRRSGGGVGAHKGAVQRTGAPRAFGRRPVNRCEATDQRSGAASAMKGV